MKWSLDRAVRAPRLTACSKGASRFAVCAVVLVTSRDAAAQLAPSGTSDELRAEYLFRAGERKFDAGLHAAACADFAESLRLGPKLGTLLNLALCHETVGKTATAWREFHHAAAWASQNSQRDRHDFATQHVVALETKLPRVLLQLPADRAIGAVDVDGEPLPDSNWYLPVFLDPGEHSVTVSAPGKARNVVKFRVVAAATEQLVAVPSLQDDLSLIPKPKLKPAPVAPFIVDHRRRIAGLVTLGVGAAGFAVGATFGVLAVSKRNEIGSECGGNRCTLDGARTYRDAQSNATIATVGTALGLAAGGIGAWLVLSSRHENPAAKPAVSLGLAPGPDGITGALWGHY
jgi:hypothetical protein